MPTTAKRPTGTNRGKKPYRDFPLFKHATGQWAKKILQRTHYFGTDADAALRKYLEQRDDLQAGRTPRVQSDGLTVADLANRFLTAKKFLVDAGELSHLTFRDYFGSCQRIVAAFGKTRLVTDLAADDFERLRADYTKTRRMVGVADAVRNVRIVFKYGFDAGLITTPIRWGTFKPPSRAKLRIERQARPPRMFESHELRSLLDAAQQPLRAMILLGINCGLGQADIARLPRSAIHDGWLNFPRPKTGVARRVPLWSVTLTAIREVDTADGELIFKTRRGQPLVHGNTDAVVQSFGKLLVKLKLKRRGVGFYALRHTLETVGGGCRDQTAVDHIMGHAPHVNDMGAVYRERIEDSRLQAVSDHVRSWLFGAGEQHHA